MLRRLHIQDYAIIEHLDVAFDRGLTIVTGETGAGKSIVVGALKLLLGDRASPDMIRTGARKAIVEGHFDVSAFPAVRRLIVEHQLDELPELIIRREIAAGSSRAFVNDSPVVLTTLRAIAESLVDLHGQHDQQSLLKPDIHRGVLDAYGQLEGLVGDVAQSYGEWRLAVRQLRDVTDRSAVLLQQAELYQFQKQEIDEVGPEEGEEEQLDQQRVRLANAFRLRDQSLQLHEVLYGETDSVYDRLSNAVDALGALSGTDSSLGMLANELQSTLISVGEIASSLRDYGDGIEDDPDRLAEVQDRLGSFEMLTRKYGGSIEFVLDYRRQIGEAPTRDSLDAERALAEASVNDAAAKLTDIATRLSAQRSETATRMEPLVVDALSRLGMAKSAFQVRVTQTEDGRVSDTGMDDVEFYISPNPGEPLRQLAKSASGGEISRIMLALKAVIAQRIAVPVLVFDEIDVGISGAVAQRVGEEMRALAHHHQVVAITHLPQIAAQGDNHYVVEKTESGGRTRTEIRPLSESERAAQIARLISGARVTDSALANARDLIDSAATTHEQQ